MTVDFEQKKMRLGQIKAGMTGYFYDIELYCLTLPFCAIFQIVDKLLA